MRAVAVLSLLAFLAWPVCAQVPSDLPEAPPPPSDTFLIDLKEAPPPSSEELSETLLYKPRPHKTWVDEIIDSLDPGTGVPFLSPRKLLDAMKRNSGAGFYRPLGRLQYALLVKEALESKTAALTDFQILDGAVSERIIKVSQKRSRERFGCSWGASCLNPVEDQAQIVMHIFQYPQFKPWVDLILTSPLRTWRGGYCEGSETERCRMFSNGFVHAPIKGTPSEERIFALLISARVANANLFENANSGDYENKSFFQFLWDGRDPFSTELRFFEGKREWRPHADFKLMKIQQVSRDGELTTLVPFGLQLPPEDKKPEIDSSTKSTALDDLHEFRMFPADSEELTELYGVSWDDQTYAIRTSQLVAGFKQENLEEFFGDQATDGWQAPNWHRSYRTARNRVSMAWEPTEPVEWAGFSLSIFKSIDGSLLRVIGIGPNDRLRFFYTYSSEGLLEVTLPKAPVQPVDDPLSQLSEKLDLQLQWGQHPPESDWGRVRPSDPIPFVRDYGRRLIQLKSILNPEVSMVNADGSWMSSDGNRYFIFRLPPLKAEGGSGLQLYPEIIVLKYLGTGLGEIIHYNEFWYPQSYLSPHLVAENPQETTSAAIVNDERPILPPMNLSVGSTNLEVSRWVAVLLTQGTLAFIILFALWIMFRMRKRRRIERMRDSIRRGQYR